ncbi:MAG TPA: chorismate mutase [Acidimicrobiaceae bacterium]|nr:chorismate mutase [Acidimicrobiaceae bacterium]
MTQEQPEQSAAGADGELDRHRRQIDEIDESLVGLLARRFGVTAEIGRYKAANGIAPADARREAEHLTRMRAVAERAGLDPDFAERILRELMAEVVRRHDEIARDAG